MITTNNIRLIFLKNILYLVSFCFVLLFNVWAIADTPYTSFEQIKSDAEKGSVRAELLLGKSYLYGFQTKQNYEEAINYFKKAAYKEDREAQEILGTLYLSEGHIIDYKLAAEWFNKALEKDSFIAAVFLQSMVSRGLYELPKKQDEYYEVYYKINRLADAFYNNNLDKDKEIAKRKKIIELVEGGDVFSIWEASNALMTDTAAFKTANDMILTVAEKGLSVAQTQFYLNNEKDDEIKSMQMLFKALENDYDKAHYIVGTHYLSGIGINKDVAKAMEHFNAAAKKGYSKAIMAKAAMHLRGLSVERNSQEAKRLFEMAAKRSEDNADMVVRMMDTPAFLYTPKKGDVIEKLKLLKSTISVQNINSDEKSLQAYDSETLYQTAIYYLNKYNNETSLKLGMFYLEKAILKSSNVALKLYSEICESGLYENGCINNLVNFLHKRIKDTENLTLTHNFYGFLAKLYFLYPNILQDDKKAYFYLTLSSQWYLEAAVAAKLFLLTLPAKKQRELNDYHKEEIKKHKHL